MSDWNVVGGKSAAKKAKQRARKKKDKSAVTEETHNAATEKGDVGVIDSAEYAQPLKATKTIYELAEEAAEAKEKNKRENAKKKRLKDEKRAKKEPVEVDVPKKAKGKKTSKKSKQHAKQQQDQLTAAELGAKIAVQIDPETFAIIIADSKKRFPNDGARIAIQEVNEALLVHLKQVPANFALTGSSRESLLGYVPDSLVKSMLSLMETQSNATLAAMFTHTVRQMVEDNKQGRACVGAQVSCELFARFEAERRRNSELVFTMYTKIAEHFLSQYPQEKVVLPILWLMNSVALSHSVTFLRVWSVLMLPLTCDAKASDAVKALCVTGLERLFPKDDHKLCMKRVKLLVTEFPRKVMMDCSTMKRTIIVAYTTKLNFTGRAVLARAYRYLRNFALVVEENCVEIVRDFLPLSLKIPSSDPHVKEQAYDLLAACVARAPAGSKRVFIDAIKSDPVSVQAFMHYILHFGKFPNLENSLVYAEFLDDVAEFAHKNAEKASIEAGQILNAIVKLKDDIVEKDEERAKKHRAAARTDPLNVLLVVTIVLLFGAVAVLAVYLLCVFNAANNMGYPVVDDVCQSYVDYGLKYRIDTAMDYLMEELVPQLQGAVDGARPMAEAIVKEVAPAVRSALKAVGTTFFAYFAPFHAAFVRTVNDLVASLLSNGNTNTSN